MANGIRTGEPPPPDSLKDVVSSGKVPEFDTPEEGWRTYWPKRCEDEDNSLKTLNDKKH